MSQILFFLTDSCRKFNLESNRVVKVMKWLSFDYFIEKIQNLKFFNFSKKIKFLNFLKRTVNSIFFGNSNILRLFWTKLVENKVIFINN